MQTPSRHVTSRHTISQVTSIKYRHLVNHKMIFRPAKKAKQHHFYYNVPTGIYMKFQSYGQHTPFDLCIYTQLVQRRIVAISVSQYWLCIFHLTGSPISNRSHSFFSSSFLSISSQLIFKSTPEYHKHQLFFSKAKFQHQSLEQDIDIYRRRNFKQ